MAELFAYIGATGYGLAGGTLAGTTAALLRRFIPYRYSLPIVVALPCVGAAKEIYTLKRRSHYADSDRDSLDSVHATILAILVGGYAVSCLGVLKASSAWRRSLWLARRSYAATARDARRQQLTTNTRPRQ